MLIDEEYEYKEEGVNNFGIIETDSRYYSIEYYTSSSENSESSEDDANELNSANLINQSKNEGSQNNYILNNDNLSDDSNDNLSDDSDNNLSDDSINESTEGKYIF